MLYVYIRVDTNDGDYVAALTKVEAGDEQLLRAISAALVAKGPEYGSCHRFYATEWRDESYADQFPQFSEYDWEVFFEYTPGCEYGFHSINKFEFIEVSSIENLLEKK